MISLRLDRAVVQIGNELGHLQLQVLDMDMDMAGLAQAEALNISRTT